jgi:hypothetical protein
MCHPRMQSSGDEGLGQDGEGEQDQSTQKLKAQRHVPHHQLADQKCDKGDGKYTVRDTQGQEEDCDNVLPNRHGLDVQNLFTCDFRYRFRGPFPILIRSLGQTKHFFSSEGTAIEKLGLIVAYFVLH